MARNRGCRLSGYFEAVADYLQLTMQTEPVTMYRYAAEVADDPIPETETEAEPTEYPITCGVNEMKKDANIRTWGQSIGADYTCLITVKEFQAATGMDATDPDTLDSFSRDRLQIRGVFCTIMKARLTGWNGTTYTWLTFGAKRIEG